jgi:hypothetical protein
MAEGEDHDDVPGPDAESFASAIELPDDTPFLSEDFESSPPTLALVAGAGHSAIGLRMIDIAGGQMGVCETGQNGGVPLARYTRTFWPQSGPQPWCAFFVSWCYLQASGQQPPWQNKGLVDSVRQWASSRGRLVSVPLRGDMFGVGRHHMGLVARSLKGKIITIEGNTSSGCVKANERPLGGLWFARP